MISTASLYMDRTGLGRIPLFADLDESALAGLDAHLVRTELPANETLFWVGDPGNEFFVIESGRVSISCPDQSGREITLSILGPGDFLGEIALLDGGPRSATARSASDAVVLSLSRDDFQQFIRDCPKAALHIMAVLGRRQRETVDKLRGIRPLDEVLEDRLTPWQQIAGGIEKMAGSQWFLLVHVVAFVSWIVINLILGKGGPDPFPFPFLCFWASCEAIFLSLFILSSQNLQGQKDRVRAELEYQIALKMQAEIMSLHQKIEQTPTAVLEQMARDGWTIIPPRLESHAPRVEPHVPHAEHAPRVESHGPHVDLHAEKTRAAGAA